MRRVVIDPVNPDLSILREIAGVLERQGAIIIPTDTLWALSVNALDEFAVRRLLKIKKRSPRKPLPIFVRDIEMAHRYAVIPKRYEQFFYSVWPGPVTAVFRKKKSLPDVVSGGYSTIGVRVPASKVITMLFDLIDFPLTGTSANISGGIPFFRIADVMDALRKERGLEPDLIVDVGDLPRAHPSTIIDFTKKNPRILRLGPVTKKELEKILGMPFGE